MSEIHSYRPQKGHGLLHDPIASIVGPRPIGWISTQSLEGEVNLAPYSFFNIFNYSPPIVAFASVGWKDTIKNVQETGEFVTNLATRELADQVNLTSSSVPFNSSEFELANLTTLPSLSVATPRVLQSPVSLECRVTQIQQLTDLRGEKLETWMTFGEVVWVHISKSLIKDGVYDTATAHPILRAGGSDYFEISPSSRFSVKRPK